MPQRPLTGIKLVAPSTVAVGEKFALKVKCLTDPYYVPPTCYAAYPRLAGTFNLSPRGIQYMDNAATRWDGELHIESNGPLLGVRPTECSSLGGTFPGDKRAIGTIPGLSFPQAGKYTISLTDPATGIGAESNVIEVAATSPEYHLYWGDLHSQTYFSDGLRIPEELYHFARYEGFLDVAAVSDHSEWLTDAQWEYFTQVTNEAYEPGQYVTFIGLEWTNRDVGHRNVYYPGAHGPIVRSGKDSLEEVYEAARAHGALVIPHHSANVEMGVKWDSAHDPNHARLVEIYSIWGNSERPAAEGNTRPILNHGGEQEGQHVVDALARGFRMGFVGGGDIHDGRPGDDLHAQQDSPEMYKNLRRQGIMGVWATELTREAIWEALWERRVYATSNVRVILRLEVCGAPMGREVYADGKRPIRVLASSEVPIAQVDVVRNGVDFASLHPDDGEVDWSIEDTASASDDYYYARVLRADGELAWSSPIWVRGTEG